MTVMTRLIGGVASVALVGCVVGFVPSATAAGRGQPRHTTPVATGVNTRSPEPPRASVDLTPPSVGRVIAVPTGGDLQRALDTAEPGDRIELSRNGVYEGPFHLRRKAGNGWIVVASSRSAGPGAATRVDPGRGVAMARLVSRSDAVLATDAGAHHYRLEDLEISPSPGARLTTLVQLGRDEARVEDLPHHIVIDRCYVHGDRAMATRRGVELNARHVAVLNSHFSDFKEAGADSQAIAGWNGTGPFTLDNNYLEAAGENVMFGGADPAILGLVPADVRITGNHFTKPVRWMRGTPGYAGAAWTVKNLLELKSARRVVIAGNVFEHSWADGQTGFAIVFTPRNQDGAAPWTAVEDVLFAENVVRRVGGGVNVLGRDDLHQSQTTRRITIRGNWFDEVGAQWGPGRLFQLLDGTEDVAILANTASQTGATVVGGDHAPHDRFVFRQNVVRHNEYGIVGSGTGSGTATLTRYFPAALVEGNVFIGGRGADYPPGNRFVALSRDVDAVRQGAGANLDALSRMMQRVIDGTPSPQSLGARLDLTETSSAGPVAWPPGLTSAAIAFWIALTLLAYVYVGYPAAIWLRSRVWPCRPILAPSEPTVSIVVAAHNEGDRIEGRIRNLLTLDYPADRREIVIGSDGSTDETVFRASRFVNRGVRVEALAEWQGKAAVLNTLVGSSSAEVVLFADARQRFDPGVLRTLVSHFADPTVGAVSGELMLESDTGGSIRQGAGFYWRYEKFIRRHESRGCSTVGVTGAIYAIRRKLFEPIPADIILDDVLIPMRIVRQGYSVRFEPEAKAYDRASSTASQEYARKVRTISGMFQLFVREPWLLNPRRNPLWFETVSHKFLRLTLPALHAIALVMPLALLHEGPVYKAALAGQVLFYASAVAGHALRRAATRPRWLAVPYAMCVMIWATVAGFARFMAPREPARWERATPVRRPMTSPRAH